MLFNPLVMLRRITAVLAMVAIVGLLALLVYDVYLHHNRADSEDEPAVVTLPARAA